MIATKLRQFTYFAIAGTTGHSLWPNYRRVMREEKYGIPTDTRKKLLSDLLAYCKEAVPYYASMMKKMSDHYLEDPIAYLRDFPILTRELLRGQFDELKSINIQEYKWFLNSTGGSTGEPVQFIQDKEYAAKAGAISLLYSKLSGREIGECCAYIWGSERDIIQGSESWKARAINFTSNTIFMNAYRMTPERMRKYVGVINKRRPKLIVAYAAVVFQFAKFIEREGLEVNPIKAIITSAEMLYPHMREKIESVFQCRVFNRYGSREAGDIACERPGYEGLWVAPWGNYLEIVDNEGNGVPPGTIGRILVTSLNNYAMPLVRYDIGDMGSLAPPIERGGSETEQVLHNIIGKTVDVFRTKAGTLIDPGYFEGLFYYKRWVRKFQIVQKGYSSILMRIVPAVDKAPQEDLDKLIAETRLLMGEDCEVHFEFMDDIPASSSGKYRNQISEVMDNDPG